MGKIIVQEETTKYPITLIGKEAGICWGTDVTDDKKNYKRGVECIQNDHGRTLEFPQVYLTIDGYSARVIRELYTHIGGAPTRLQASTRYINYNSFAEDGEYITPASIKKDKKAKEIYSNTMNTIEDAMKALRDMDIPKEDYSMLLPLAMTSKMVLRTNLRNLIDMSHQRLCNRANWEFRILFHDIMRELKSYSSEWVEIVNNTFKPKCRVLGYCPEKYSCGAHEKSRLKEMTKQLEAAGMVVTDIDDLK